MNYRDVVININLGDRESIDILTSFDMWDTIGGALTVNEVTAVSELLAKSGASPSDLRRIWLAWASQDSDVECESQSDGSIRISNSRNELLAQFPPIENTNTRI